MNMNFFRAISLFALFGATTTSMADPVVNSASGSATPGSTVTIGGSGFGATGPRIVMFDDFERGTAGQTIGLTAPIGNWTTSASTPIFSSTARSGRSSFLVYDGSGGEMRQLRVALEGDQTEVFFSYWVRVPDGTFYPGQNVTGPRMYSSDSSWKHAWLLDDSSGYSDTSKFDMWFPAHSGRGAHNISSNDSYTLGYPGSDWWSWSSWMRISVWARSGSPTGFFQTVSSEKGLDTMNFGSKSVFGAAASDHFNQLNFPGWIRTGTTDSRIVPVYDDIYVAVGRGAVARVELADASTYAQSKNISVIPVTQWQSGSITARVPQGGVGAGSSWYVYVTDADGRTNANGYRLASCTSCPSAPTNVDAN